MDDLEEETGKEKLKSLIGQYFLLNKRANGPKEINKKEEEMKWKPSTS